MSDNTDLIYFMANKKSAVVAFILSFIIPGAGHMYCGKVLSGIFLLAIFLFSWLVPVLGLVLAPIIYFVILIDGTLAAGRLNKKLISKMEASEKAIETQNNTASLGNENTSEEWARQEMLKKQKTNKDKTAYAGY